MPRAALALAFAVIAATAHAEAAQAATALAATANANAADADPACPAACINGTVAAGGPVAASVVLRDAAGQRRDTVTDRAGRFALPVAGLRPPFLLRASGRSGSDARELVLVSAATRDDIGRHVAITPLTDLIVGNVAGRAAASFFDTPDWSRVTRSELDAARNVLAARVGPLLAAFGVAPGFDLLRARFDADHGGIDGALGVLRISTDAPGRRARILDLVSLVAIEDDLARRDDRSALPAPTPAALAAALRELDATKDVFARFNALFKNRPLARDEPALARLFDPGFLHSGRDLGQTLGPDGWLGAGNPGVSLDAPRIVGRGRDGRTLRVAFDWRNAAGEAGADATELRRAPDGGWRLAGNRRLADVHLTTLSVRPPFVDGIVQHHLRRLDIDIDETPRAVQYVQLAGPGLPAETDYLTLGRLPGLLLMRAASGRKRFVPVDASLAPLADNWVPECGEAAADTAGAANAAPGVAAAPSICVDFARLGGEAELAVTFLDAARAPLGEASRAEFVADWSAQMTSSRRDNTRRPLDARPAFVTAKLAARRPEPAPRKADPAPSRGGSDGVVGATNGSAVPLAAGVSPLTAAASPPIAIAPTAATATAAPPDPLRATLADLRDWARTLRTLIAGNR